MKLGTLQIISAPASGPDQVLCDSRMHRDRMNGGDPRSKQPRALEDGNWVCEDIDCGNVNYPRRTECNKCGKRRGQVGDAVVRAYMETMKTQRDPHSSPVVGGSERFVLDRGMMPQNGHDSPQHGLRSSGSSLGNDLDSWMGTGFEQLPSYSLHYAVEGRGLSSCSSTLSAAKEGKRIAEQLVATFAASPDPLRDAGECLASAALWLQTMKARLQNGDGGLSPIMQINGGVSSPSPLSGMNGLEYSRGGHLPRLNGNIAPRTIPFRPHLRYEDYKDRPSDFLREFGDPAAVSASSMGGSIKPEPGVFGNWECDECLNVNFPRRTNCFQCHKKRGPRGDDIVRRYVRSLIEEAGGLV
ncbi:hypothetical protein O6H91_Y224400 [Diphasiastrum complanatum]|nr:hypothetical protein O6H91_Y224400 [Diphasiastrum complanatum]